MPSSKNVTRRIGLAEIRDYEVTWDHISYKIMVRECLRETFDKVEEIPDFEMKVVIPIAKPVHLMRWFADPLYDRLQDSWLSHETNCLFEHNENEDSALMTFKGLVVLVPVMKQSL